MTQPKPKKYGIGYSLKTQISIKTYGRNALTIVRVTLKITQNLQVELVSLVEISEELNVKIDPADKYFSQWIRFRDKQCMRCKSPVRFNEKGLPVTHQNSHYFGRGRQGTRFEPDNCDTLCHGCHRFWEKEDREAYREFKVEQLGTKRYASLTLQANSYHKKDYKMAQIFWKAELDKELS